MTTPLLQPSHTGTHFDDPDSVHASDTNTSVELRSLHYEKNVEADRHNTKNAYSKPRPTKVPLQGPAALLSIVLLTGAAVGVLLASRGSPIEKLKVHNVRIQPQVWLSLLSTIMDGLTMFAATKAVEITFWRTAVHGTTLRSMYDLYESQSTLGALKNLFRLRGDRVAVVSILCLVSALRGPLFQRASIIDSNATRNITGKQELKVAQLVRPNFLYQGSSLFDKVYNAYLERAPIHINTTNERGECGDNCNGKVKGYGFDIKCSDVFTIPWDNSYDSTVKQMFQETGNHIGDTVPAFNSSATLPGGMDDLPSGSSHEAGKEAEIAADQQGKFQVTNLFKPEPICGGDLSVHKCSLHHAVVEYDVTLSNGTLSLTNVNWQDDNVLFQTPTWHVPTPFSPNLYFPWGPTVHWVSWYNAQFNEEVSIYSEDDGYTSAGPNVRMLLAKGFINGNIDNVSCSTTFGNPTQFVLNRLREIAFRTAVAAAAIEDPVLLFGNAELERQGRSHTQNWTQDVDVTGQTQFVAYTVNIPYLICAAICSLLAVVAMLPLYWIARGDILIMRSSNPLDIAHVFNAPILQDVYEADIGSYVQKEEGPKRVRCSTEQWESREDIGLVRVVPEN